MILVLDTNCLIHILSKNSPHHWLFQTIKSGEIKLAITTEIISEYEETLNNFFESETLGENVTKAIINLPNTLKVEIYYKWQLISKDPDDDKYVDCAIAANADYIISDDNHFKVLKTIDFPKVICLRLEEFYEIWKREDS